MIIPMKHLITKIEYVTEAVRDTHNVNIETDSIEQTRKELHRLMLCNRILLVYQGEKK